MKNNKSNTITLSAPRAFRTRLFIFLYNISLPAYRIFIKRKRPKWKVSLGCLSKYPIDSLGYQYALFLERHGLQPMDNFENHDCFHVLLNFPTDIKGESAMQFCLMGNGKRSIYMYSMIIFSTIFFPENITHFIKAYRMGKSLNVFHHWDYEQLLCTPVAEIRSQIFKTQQI